MTVYTHFKNLSAVLKLAVGAKGSEVQISDADGNLFQAGTQLTPSAAEINAVIKDCTATAAEINAVADVSTNTLEVTTTAATAVTAGVQNLEINVSSGVGVTTIADLTTHQGYFSIKQTGASTSGASVTATAGTWDGTNNIATTNAAKDALFVHIDSAGAGTIVENVGSVALSS